MEGQSVAGKINAPKGMINVRADGVVVVAAIITGTPMIHLLEDDPLEFINTGDFVRINADEGYILLSPFRSAILSDP